MKVKKIHECKNCSSKVVGKYCHFCGQQYKDHKESFGELTYEFFSDFLHFDSRFFKTIYPLIFKPGKLTKSYNDGKQRDQFHPIRLYLFSSFVYFFLFFAFNNQEYEPDMNRINASVIGTKDSILFENQNDSKKLTKNDVSGAQLMNEFQTNGKQENLPGNKKDIIPLQDSALKYSFTFSPYVDSLLIKKVTPAEYLNQQKMMSGENKAGFLERIFTARLLKINLKGGEGIKGFSKEITESFFHNIPKMLFFLLPVFALLLKLLYIRHKQFYYVDHAVFSLHFFSLIFLLLIVSDFILDSIFGTGIFTFLAFIWITIYMLISMKRLYGERWGRTIMKFCALGFFFFLSVAITMIANMAISVLML